MAINFNISTTNTLNCPITRAEFSGEKNPELPSMLFYICHNAEERLKLIDKMLLSGWYQKRAGTVTMTDVKMHFSISESLFNAERECHQLLTSDGKININGLHGARRSALYLDRTYSIVCPHCRTQSPKVIESVALNRLLLFGKIEITRKEACLSKVEEFKDYLWPLRNWISTMWHQLHHLGFNQLSLFLHTLDRYVRSIEKYPQHILFVAVVMKASLIGLKKLGVKSLELPLANCTEMINNSIKVAAAIFFLRGMIEAVEEGDQFLCHNYHFLSTSTLLFLVEFAELSLLRGHYRSGSPADPDHSKWLFDR